MALKKNSGDFVPRFTINNRIAGALTRIERARGFLDAAKLSHDWICEMQARALVLEAHHTTHIEGTHLTLEQSERLLGGQPVPEANLDDALELLNYRNAFDLVAGYLGSGAPITEELIKEIHHRLVIGVRGNQASPGDYRTIQCHVVNSATGRITYTPPTAGKVPGLMGELLTWLNIEAEIHPVLIAAIAQFQLVDIHPFCDGNGRTARLLSTLCLYRRGYDFKRLFTISEYYDRNRADYYQAIKTVREQEMDLTLWLEYFAEGLATQMQEVQERGKRVIKKGIVLLKARKAGIRERAISVLEFLIEHRKGTVTQIESSLSLNRRTLQRDLKLLVEKGLVREIAANPTDPTKNYEPLL
jgi:Fic family protein